MLLLLALFAQIVQPDIAAPSPSPHVTATPSASAPASADSAGPCATAALASIADRPGLGKGPAASGAVCVAPPGTIVVGIGYRSQVTTNGSSAQQLVVVPAPIVLAGIPGNNEFIVAPGLGFSHRSGGPAFGLTPVDGQQDVGVGIQHVLSDRVRVQQAVELFATAPTGYPSGLSGFTAGGATYQFAYTIALTLGNISGLSLSNTVNVAPGFAPDGSIQRFIAYQPSLTFSITVTPSTTLLLEDQQATLTAPHGPSGNRALAGLQQTLLPNLVVDLDYEHNLMPPSGFVQHTTFEGGITVRL